MLAQPYQQPVITFLSVCNDIITSSITTTGLGTPLNYSNTGNHHNNIWSEAR